jgi:phytoene desaturase
VRQRSFIVVGAGMGGLAIALRLAHKGHKVTVLEKTGEVGGRNRPAKVNGCGFDGGPTLMMMREPFDRLFSDVGERLDEHLQLSLADPSYRVFYSDGTQLEGTPNRERMAALIEARFGEADARGYQNMLRDLQAMYEDAIPRFVRKNFYRSWEFFGFAALKSAMRHRMLGNLASGIARYVKHPKLRMLFSFQSMYLGLSPYEAPWVYAVLTYMEYGEGIWYPQGGLVRIGTAIAELAKGRGAEIRLNCPVDRVEGNEVVLESGERLTADAVVVNADLPYAERELLKEKRKPRKSSCSAYVMYIDYKGSLPKLLHHNVFFGHDFKGNLDQIFTQLQLPEDPAFYVAVSARSDPAKAPAGHENVMVLVPCPNLDRKWTTADAETLKKQVYERLEREVDFRPDQVVGFDSYDPTLYQSELNLDRGAAFGLSHHFSQSALFRPGNRSRVNPNVYFVGASTVPGNGLPMVLISAELVEERLERELGGANISP